MDLNVNLLDDEKHISSCPLDTFWHMTAKNFFLANKSPVPAGRLLGFAHSNDWAADWLPSEPTQHCCSNGVTLPRGSLLHCSLLP